MQTQFRQRSGSSLTASAGGVGLKVLRVLTVLVAIALASSACGSSVTVEPVLEPGISATPSSGYVPNPFTVGSGESGEVPKAGGNAPAGDEIEPGVFDPIAEATIESLMPDVPESTVDAIYDASFVADLDLADGTAVIAPECQPGDGYSITNLQDVLIKPALIEPELIDAQEAAGEVIPAIVIPGVIIPGAVVDAGCIIEYDAPGGCLPAVTITGVSIPATAIPGLAIPGFTVGAVSIVGDEAAGEQVAGDSASPRSVEQVCQIEVAPGDTVPSLFRSSLTRTAIFRDAIARRSLSRQGAMIDGERIPLVLIDQVLIAQVHIDQVTVPHVSIPGQLTDDVPGAQVFEGEETKSYFAEADVLLDFDESSLAAGSDVILRGIAADIEQNYPSGPIRVDGHTDSVGSERYNDELSRARAQTVTDWFVANAGFDRSRIEATGYGETFPVAANDNGGVDNPAGRAQNRRVVITASRED